MSEWTVQAGGLICLPLPAIPTARDICLPGNLCLSVVWDGIGQIPHAADIPLQLFGQLGPAMAGLKPLFDVVEFAVAAFKCIKAIPDAITQLDVTELLKCVPELAKAIDKILALIPQLSIPRAIIALLKQMATLVEALAADFLFLQSQLQRILDGLDRAADLGDTTLAGFLVCAQSTVRDSAMSTAEALRGIGRVILLCNILLSLTGLDVEIPCFSGFIDAHIDEGFEWLAEQLTAIGAVLREVADAIPDPMLELTIALEAQRC
jgi:hypothetical protein